MVDTEEVTTTFRVEDAEFNRKMDRFETRIEKAERTAKRGGGRAGSAFFGGVVGGAAGFVAGQVLSSGPVGAIAETMTNLILAAFAPALLKLANFLGSENVQQVLGDVAGGVAGTAAGVGRLVSGEGGLTGRQERDVLLATIGAGGGFLAGGPKGAAVGGAGLPAADRALLRSAGIFAAEDRDQIPEGAIIVREENGFIQTRDPGRVEQTRVPVGPVLVPVDVERGSALDAVLNPPSG